MVSGGHTADLLGRGRTVSPQRDRHRWSTRPLVAASGRVWWIRRPGNKHGDPTLNTLTPNGGLGSFTKTDGRVTTAGVPGNNLTYTIGP